MSDLPYSIIIRIMSLNEYDRIWHRQVCRTARESFVQHTTVVASSPSLPLWALQQMCKVNTSTSQRVHVAAGRAAAGDIAGLAWLRSSMDNCTVLAPPVCAAAAAAGNIQVLHWLRSQRPACNWDFTACTAAARSRQLEALQWLRSQQPRCPWAGVEVWEAAAAAGCKEVLGWLRMEQCPGWGSPSICSAAAAAGQVSKEDTLKCVVEAA